MSDIKQKYGLIGFFDILGYTNIIENNEIEKVAEIVGEKLVKIPGLAQTKILEPVKDKQQSQWKVLAEKVSWLAFSDIILLTMPLDRDSAKPELEWFVFLLFCEALNRTMFDEGLPLRGAISIGPFYIHERCFAGKPIIDCYKLANQTDWTGCVLHPDAKVGFAAARDKVSNENGKKLFSRIFVDYLVPMTHGEPMRMSALNWAFGNLRFNSIGSDVRGATVNSFQRHNKDVPPSVYSKINNTEMFLYRTRQQFERVTK
jgi:hypothetical protein